MNKNIWSIIGGILLVLLLIWLFGNKISCHENFWDKNQQVIEIKHTGN
jgi:hypothetical protein